MRETERIADQLERVVAGHAWHGPSLHEVLRGIDATDAIQRPPHVTHTIHELVLHITVWLDVVARRLRGTAYDPTPEQDWPAPETGQLAWSDVMRALDDTFVRLRDDIRALDDDALTRTVPGRDYDNYVMLHGAVQHTAYHIGQIAVVRRFL